MRIVFSGANSATVKTAEQLIKQGLEVLLIELEEENMGTSVGFNICNKECFSLNFSHSLVVH